MKAVLTAVLTAGYRSVNLTVQQPLEDDGITPRTDFVGMKAWGSNTTGFTPGPLNLLFDGRGLSWTLEKLAPGVPVYIRYALISEIEPENYIVSSELTATPTEIPNSITVSNGVLQGVSGVGDGISIDNAYANRILEWNTDNALVYAHGSKVGFIGNALPPEGSIGAQCKLSTAPGASLTFSDDGGMWGVSIGLGIFGIPQYSVNFEKISSAQTKVTISGISSYETFIPTAGLKQVEIYPKTIEVYAENGALLLQHPWAGVQSDDVLVTLTVDLRSIDASVKNITFAQARYKVFDGSMQPGSVPANALKPVSLATIGALAPTSGGVPYYTAPDGPASLFTSSTWFRSSWAPLADATAGRIALQLGSAATKSIPSSGDASSTQIVMGNDSRLTNARSPTDHSEHGAALTYPVALRGSVTQATSHTTPVTLDKLQGSIKMALGSIPAGGSVEFQFNNTYIDESSMPIVVRRGSSFASITASVLRFAIGYCIVRVTNTGTSAATNVNPALSFSIIGCASA